MQSDLQLALTAAREAGRAARSLFERGVEVRRKPGGEPVTEADHAAQAVIVEHLDRTHPNDGILSEEQPERANDWRDRRRAWLVDPIDGTREFIAGGHGFAVMIGLLVDATPTVGVVHQPMIPRTYWAELGQGAWIDEGEGPPRRLRASEVRDPRAARIVASASHRSPFLSALKQSFGASEEQKIGGVGQKVGLVAQGLRDVYVNSPGRGRLWDTCAPQVVISEAGGRLTDLRGLPLDYRDTDITLHRGLAVSNGHLHRALLEAISEAVDAWEQP